MQRSLAQQQTAFPLFLQHLCCSHQQIVHSRLPHLRPSFTDPSQIRRCTSRKIHCITTPATAIRVVRMAANSTLDANGAANSEAKSLKIGFLGLGVMGVPMALNLVKAGYDLTVWNRSKDKCKSLEEAGAQVGDSARAVAEGCDLTFAMLADPAAALDVAESVAQGKLTGKGYVDVSTIDAESARKVQAALKGAGALYLEAPVSGSKQPAEQGALIFLTAGDRELFERASPLLDVMGKAKFFLGEVGKGANMKLAVNMVMGTMMTSLAEGITLAEKAGLDTRQFVEVTGLGAIAAPMFGLKGPAMVESRFPTAFPLKHQRKDLQLALRLAEEHCQTLPTAAAATDLFVKAEKEGHGDEDFSAVLQALLS